MNRRNGRILEGTFGPILCSGLWFAHMCCHIQTLRDGLNNDCVPGRVLHPHWSPPGGGRCSCPQFSDEKTETQSGLAPSSRSYSLWEADLGLEPRWPVCRARSCPETPLDTSGWECAQTGHRLSPGWGAPDVWWEAICAAWSPQEPLGLKALSLGPTQLYRWFFHFVFSPPTLLPASPPPFLLVLV